MEKALRLGVDGWRITSKHTGIARYLMLWLKHWTPETVGHRFDEINLYVPTAIDRVGLGLSPVIRDRVLAPRSRMLIWDNVRLGPGTNDDVLLCPSFSRPLITRSKTVVVVHDVTWKMYPELYPPKHRSMYEYLYTWSARNATRVLTSTRTVRDDIVKHVGVPHSRIRVVPLAIDEIFRPICDEPLLIETRNAYVGGPFPYFLFVGKLTIRRNVPKLLEAFAEFKRRTEQPQKLLIIGLDTQGLNVTAMAERLNISDDVVHHEYISDTDLVRLYNAADAFVMPSIFETISLPVMESQASGTPVITIDTPGMRETTSGEALLIPKADVSDIAAALERIAGDEALRRQLSEGGLKRARRLSWQQSSIDTLAVLEEAARSA